MFIELAAMVELQGELIDNIELNVRTAKENVLAAEEDIIKSKKNMQSARKVLILFNFLRKNVLLLLSSLLF